MEGKSDSFNRALWFTIGYFVAISVEILADRLIEYLSSLESSGVILSENGKSGEKGETVTSLVKEETSSE